MEHNLEKASLIHIVPTGEELEKRVEIKRGEIFASRRNQALYVNITQF